jgi:hypothetical protein
MYTTGAQPTLVDRMSSARRLTDGAAGLGADPGGVHLQRDDRVGHRAPVAASSLASERWSWGRMRAVCPQQAPSANYRIDTANRIGRTTPRSAGS